MSINICPQCKAENRVTARFCAECGAPLLGGLLPGPPDVSTSDGLKPGTILQNRYRIDKELGSGGFGAVYKAWDSNVNHMCAVKENLETSPEAQRQFSREATVLANLSHPNLPRVTDHFSIPDQGQYLVMDFVEGEDLATLANHPGGVEVSQALKWIGQVADALVYLHGRQPPVLHRDIKPANIRITPEGQAMLVDFGLVKLYDPHLKTTMGARAVTPGYAPPEQYGRGRTDARSDIYALGATLYCVVAREDPPESVSRISGEQIRRADELNPQVSALVCEVIEKSMALDPKNRFQNAAEFREALSQVSAPVPIVAEPPPLKTVVVAAPRSQDSRAAGTVSEDRGTVTPAPVSTDSSGSALFVAPESGVHVRPAVEAGVANVPGVEYRERPQGGQEAVVPKARPKALIFGLGAVVLLVLLVIIALVGVGISTKSKQARLDTQQAQTAVVQAQLGSTQTQIASNAKNTAQAFMVVKETSQKRVSETANAYQTATSHAGAMATSQKKATEVAQTTSAARTSATAQYAKDLLAAGKGWPVEFSDAFDSNKNGWRSGSLSDEYTVATLSIADGVYQITSKALKGFVWRFSSDNMPKLTDFYLSVDLRQVSGPSDGECGIAFRTDGQSNYYILAFQPDGRFYLDVHTSDGEWNEVKDWTDSPGWITGISNRVAVIVQGTRFSIFVNGQLVGQTSDSRLTSGWINLAISLNNANDQAVWEFDNLEVRAP